MLRAWMWTVVVACAHAYVAGGRVAVAACLVAHARARMAGSHPLRLPRVIDADDVRGWGTTAKVVGDVPGNERYFTLLDAGDRVWLLSRDDEVPAKQFPRRAVIRRDGDADAPLGTAPPELLVESKSLAHNLAATWWKGKFVAFGGEDQNLTAAALRPGAPTSIKSKPWARGVAAFSEDRETFVHRQIPFDAPVVLRGSHAGCREERRSFGGVCEFDGKLSALEFRGRLRLYARANLSARGGGRGVQTTSAPDVSGPWEPFEVVDVLGFDARRRENGAYFAAVNVNPVDDQTVLGIFPVREGPRAFVAVALSRDGVRFSRFREILKSTAADQGRSTDHPVDGLLVRGDNVFLYAHRDVPPFSRGRPRIVRLETTLDELRAYTVKAKAELDAAWPPEDGGPVTIAYRPANKTAAPLASGADRDLPRVATYRVGAERIAAPGAYAWLKLDAWSAHARRIYGDVEHLPTIGDVDLVRREDLLPPTMALRAGCPASDDEPFKRFNWHAPYSSFRYFRRRTAVDAAPRAFANGSMVEVTHCGGSKFETNGAFFYAFRGTGLYVNAKKTIAFETHDDAARHFLGRRCVDGKPVDLQLGIFQCDAELPEIVSAARSSGWDSLQFTRHCDAFCHGGKMGPALDGTDARSQLCGFELVLVNAAGTEACPAGVEFRRGLGGTEACACNATLGPRSQRGACAACAPFS